MKEPYSTLITGALAWGAMAFVVSLSSSGRGAVDWMVIGLVALAIA